MYINWPCNSTQRHCFFFVFFGKTLLRSNLKLIKQQIKQSRKCHLKQTREEILDLGMYTALTYCKEHMSTGKLKKQRNYGMS